MKHIGMHGQWEQELFETLQETFNNIQHFVNTMQTIHSDIAGKDITKMDWDKVSKKDWCLDQNYFNAKTSAGMLNGTKCNKRYIECRVYPLRLKDQTFPPLFNDDIDFLLNKSKNVKKRIS